MKITIEFNIFKLVLVLNFSYNKQYWFFGAKLPEHQHWILHTKISLSTKFQLKLTILVFQNKIFPKRAFLVEKRKRQHHRWVAHIRISVDTKFRLKLTVLIFCTKFPQKSNFWSKIEKMNTIIEFCIFKLA